MYITITKTRQNPSDKLCTEVSDIHNTLEEALEFIAEMKQDKEFHSVQLRPTRDFDLYV